MGQRGGHSGLVGALVSSTLALDTTVIRWHWGQGRGCRCCPHAADGDQPILCTSLCVPGMCSPLHRCVQVCQALPPSRTQKQVPPVMRIAAVPSGAMCLLPYTTAGPGPGMQSSLAAVGRAAPQIPTQGAAWPLPRPHPCNPTPLLCRDHGDLWVSSTWPSPNPLPGILVGLDGTTQAGHILALLGHLDLSVAPKSGSLWLVHPHPLGAGKNRVQSRL